jgi:hypothetical protein
MPVGLTAVCRSGARLAGPSYPELPRRSNPRLPYPAPLNPLPVCVISHRPNSPYLFPAAADSPRIAPPCHSQVKRSYAEANKLLGDIVKVSHPCCCMHTIPCLARQLHSPLASSAIPAWPRPLVLLAHGRRWRCCSIPHVASPSMQPCPSSGTPASDTAPPHAPINSPVPLPPSPAPGIPPNLHSPLLPCR